MQLKWLLWAVTVAWPGMVVFGPGEDAVGITPSQLDDALDGVRPALERVHATPLITPKLCRGADPSRSEGQLDAWRDAGAVDLPLTMRGCMRERRTHGDGFTRRETFVFDKAGARRRDAVELRNGLVLEARDTNADGVFDEESLWRFSDAGLVSSGVTFVYPTDGGHALRQDRSVALGDNARHVDVLRWRDGGWEASESFESHWRDEAHFGR